MSVTRALRALIHNRMALAIVAGVVLINGIGDARSAEPRQAKSDGPGFFVNPFPHQAGDPGSGQQVFRFETFGNEGFWTDAVRLPQGMMAARFTPLDALRLGLHVDADALNGPTRAALARELRSNLSPRNAPLLNSPTFMEGLIGANAIIGMVTRDTNQDGRLEIRSGDKVGVACSICHSITDGSVFNPGTPLLGSIGSRMDGRATHSIDVGGLFALGANSRALYPDLQLELGGRTVGRAPRGLTPNSTEAEVDAYFRNKSFYPRGLFDDTPDGVGNPIQNTPLFRTDLSAPHGTAGEHAVLDNFGNAVYTVLLDMTTLVTPEGRTFLRIRAGAAGEELANGYAKVLAETGVTGFPFVQAFSGFKPGDPASPVGRRVDNQKLLDMNAYTDRLPAPPGARVNRAAAARGRELFRARCTSCHNVDQGKFVPPLLIAPSTIFPAYRPSLIALRMPPQTPVQNSPGTFDDKFVVVDASDRGAPRGNALTLLLDLGRKPRFLHDASVPSLDSLLNPVRGRTAPHPFYLPGAGQRADMVAFLTSLE
jgi:cytochrome c2